MTKFKRNLGILVAVLVMVVMTGVGVFATEPALDQNEGIDEVSVEDEITQETPSLDTKGTSLSETSETSAVPIPIDSEDVTLQSIPDQTLDAAGRPVTLDADDLVLEYLDEETGDKKTLVEDTDFTTAYANNTAVGTATVTIEGIGEFTGERSASFKIVQNSDRPKPVKKVTCLAGCSAFKIVWKPNTDKDQVDYYFIKRKKSGKVDRTRITSEDEMKACAWENAYKIKKKTKYTFVIYAVKVVGDPDTADELKNGTGDDLVSDPMKTQATETADRRMVIKVTMKSTIGSLKAGKTYNATGFGSGQYKIPNKGRTYSVARYRVKNQKGVYVKHGELSHDAVDFFMNGGKTWAKATKANKYKYSFAKKNKFSTSRTYWVWVNTYNQHVYVLKKSGSKWKCVDDWRCSMGTASTPSPMGMKTIIKYRAYHPGHGAPYWNFISWNSNAQHGTALHGLESGWAKKLGTLASHGCIRNPSAKAKALHDKYSGNGMKVYIW